MGFGRLFGQTTPIDIAIHETGCGDFEVVLKSDVNISNTNLTSVQFAIKWPDQTGLNLDKYKYKSSYVPNFHIAQQGGTIQNGWCI